MRRALHKTSSRLHPEANSQKENTDGGKLAAFHEDRQPLLVKIEQNVAASYYKVLYTKRAANKVSIFHEFAL